MLYSENLKIEKSGISFTDKHGKKLSMAQAISKITSRFFNWWLDFKLYTIHLVSDFIPFHFIRKAVFNLAGVKQGPGTTLHMGVHFFEPRGVRIGEDTKIGQKTFLDGRAQLTIGNHVDMASEVMIYNSEHDLNSDEFKAVDGEVKIGDYVFVGPRAIILPGVTVGRGAVIAAGAVVTKSVEDFKIVGGVPALVIGERKNKKPNYRLGRARLFQ